MASSHEDRSSVVVVVVMGSNLGVLVVRVSRMMWRRVALALGSQTPSGSHRVERSGLLRPEEDPRQQFDFRRTKFCDEEDGSDTSAAQKKLQRGTS